MIDKRVFLNFRQVIEKNSELSQMNSDTFDYLLNAVSEETKNILLESFLYEAIMANNIDLIKLLLSKNVPYDGSLIEAVSIQDIKMVEIILKHDSSPSFINIGKSMLH